MEGTAATRLQQLRDLVFETVWNEKNLIWLPLESDVFRGRFFKLRNAVRTSSTSGVKKLMTFCHKELVAGLPLPRRLCELLHVGFPLPARRGLSTGMDIDKADVLSLESLVLALASMIN